MPVQKIDLKTFLSLSRQHPVFDVRSPQEYAHAHIPQAISLPIFTDEQRAEIGTSYKQVSREDAIKIGLKHFGPMMETFVLKVEDILAKRKFNDKKILVHCWRGGMRSGAMAWLLGFYGFDVHLLDGGYKSYRSYVLKQFELPFKLNVIGGYTGSGKTEVLHQLKKNCLPVVDLESLANHKGSAFGSLNREAQPSQEQFENNLHQALSFFYSMNDDRLDQPESIWIENESQRIGTINIPNSFFGNMQESHLYSIDVPFEERLRYIAKDYGKADKEKLINAIVRIQKKLGGLDTKTAINYLIEDNICESFRILLKYYDKRYQESADKNLRNKTIVVSDKINPLATTQQLLESYKANHS